MINCKFFINEINQKYLKIESNSLEKYAEYIDRNRIENIAFNSVWGYHLKDVCLILDCQSIRRLMIVDNDINLNCLPKGINLLTLQCESNPTTPIDLLSIGKLEELSINYNKCWKNLFLLSTLEKLSLFSYRSRTFQVNTKWDRLRVFELIQGSLVSMNGIDNFQNLEILSLRLLSKMSEVVFTKKMPKLRRLIIEDCIKIKQIAGFEYLPNLEELIILNCKNIPSCDFLINSVPNLKKVTIKGTKVMDGSERNIVNFDEYFYGNDRPLLSHLL